MHMLRKASELRGYTLFARDGELGTIEEFFFDDATWTVRYIAVRTGAWLSGKRVLVSPIAVQRIDEGAGRVLTTLHCDQMRHSPGIDVLRPLTRQFESEYHRYFGWPVYWGGHERWGTRPFPMDMKMPGARPASDRMNGGTQLRSTADIEGYGVQARDGSVGHVEDFIIDDETWAVRYLVADTRTWRPGKKVLVSPHWVDEIRWTEKEVCVDLLRETVRNAPAYDPYSVITKDYETKLFGYYGREEDLDALFVGKKPVGAKPK